MVHVRFLRRLNMTSEAADVQGQHPHFERPRDILEGALADLYGAVLIAVPVALFLNPLWL